MGAFTEIARQHPREAMTHLGFGAAYLNAVPSRATLNKHTHAARGIFSISQSFISGEGGDSLKERFGSDLHLSAAPYHIPLSLKAAEKSFNSGRAAHQLGLLDLAVKFYGTTLRLIDEVAPLVGVQRITTSGEVVSAVVSGCGVMDLRRESAFNLALLLKEVGDAPKALEVTLKYLSYD